MAVGRFTSNGLSALIVILAVFFGVIVADKTSELSNQSSEKQQAAVFGSAGFVFLREQLEHGDATIKERLDERYDSVKEQLKEGDSLLKEQLSEGIARLKEQLKEGDDNLKEQLNADEDWLKSKLLREEVRKKEELAEMSERTQQQLAKQQATIDDLKKLVEQWTTKNSAQVERTLQEFSDLKNQLEVTKTSLQDTREKLNNAKIEFQTTQEALRTTQEVLNVTLRDLKSTKSAESPLDRHLAEIDRVNAVGATFVRWGHRKCPSNTSDIVYSGAVGGSYYTHTGGSPTHLCLTLAPEPNPWHYLVTGHAFLHGAEYEEPAAVAEHDIPCAVCRTQGATSTIMVPGALTCPPGWTQQYTGLLASGHYGHVRGSDTICLDGDLEKREGGHGSKDGDLFYLLNTVCGSLPCPPYVNTKLVTCVVCTL